MRTDIIVTRRTNDRPPHVHLRGSARGPARTASAYAEACREEFERLERSKADIEFVEYAGHHVVLKASGEGFSTEVEIEARVRA